MIIRTPVAILVTLAGLCLLAAPNAAIGVVEADFVKYYVVGPPINGHRENLFQIAAKTLGDINRHREIFDVNQGRSQPDGGRLTDGLDLRPGWILLLWPDARGDGVFVAASTPMVAPGTARPAALPPQPPAASATDPASTGWTLNLIRVAGLLVTALLLAVTVRAVRGSTGRLPHVTSAPLPIPPPAAPALSPSPELQPDGLPRAPLPVGSPRTPKPVVRGLQAQLRHGGQRLEVRLIGNRRSPTGWTWLQPGERPPPAPLAVLLGGSANMRLHVDLAATPDIVTIIGSLGACHRLVLAYALQLRAAGAKVVLVGGALAGTAPTADPTVATVAELLDDPIPDNAVVICDPLAGAELVAARELLTRTDGRLVPVIIGSVLRSRWSVRIES